jgi:hypothetical protein
MDPRDLADPQLEKGGEFDFDRGAASAPYDRQGKPKA